MVANVLRADPSRTGLIRAKFERDMLRRWDRLRLAVVRLVEGGAFGLVGNAAPDWSAMPPQAQLEALKAWMLTQLYGAGGVLETDPNGVWWFADYIREAYLRGAGRAFDEVKYPSLTDQLDFYAGTRKQFLQSAFGRPVSLRRVQLIASRTFNDLQGVSEAASTAINRELVGGMIQGLSPREVARRINAEVEGIGRKRALVIARTETVRAHAEGQLDAFSALGVEEIGAAIEWSDADDRKVCPLCKALDGIVLKTKEAHGMIPRHPNCRCAWIPANVGESGEGQFRTRKRIEAALLKSARLGLGKKGAKLSSEQVKAASGWAGSKAKIAGKRPKSILED